MITLALSALLASMGVSISNIALPAIAAGFDATFPQVQWVTIAYLLAATVMVVSPGALATGRAMHLCCRPGSPCSQGLRWCAGLRLRCRS